VRHGQQEKIMCIKNLRKPNKTKQSILTILKTKLCKYDAYQFGGDNHSDLEEDNS